MFHPDDVVFHKGLHCLVRKKMIFSNQAIITCDPTIYTMDHPKFIVSNQKEEPICK